LGFEYKSFDFSPPEKRWACAQDDVSFIICNELTDYYTSFLVLLKMWFLVSTDPGYPEHVTQIIHHFMALQLKNLISLQNYYIGMLLKIINKRLYE